MSEAATVETTWTPPDPSVMRGVIPYLGMDGRAGEAADFYAKAFGARDIGRMPGEKPGELMHCQVEINGGSLMMTDMRGPDEPAQKPQGFHLQLVVADGDLWWNRAVAAGCTVVMPFEKMFWGDRWGLLADPFGITWSVDEAAEFKDAGA
jgi:PhnB protein